MNRNLKVENVLSDLIRIQSVNPPGGETAVAMYLKNLFDSYSIPNEIIEPSPGRASFIAHMGEGKKSLLFMAHTDVVPVSGGWDFSPFSGEIKDGFIHGRGALDCKGLVVAEACAVIRLAQDNKLGGKLIFAATADEETGGTLGMKYLMEHCPDKVKADFAINEGAEAPANIGGKITHSISVGEKGPFWIKLTARGVSAHGSVPSLGTNAVVKMADAVARLASYKPKIVLTPETQQQIQTIADGSGFKGKINTRNVNSFIEGLGDRSLAAYLRAITRMTVSPNVIQGGIKTNIVPDGCEAQIDVRVLPGQDKDYVLKELLPLLGDLEIEPIQYHEASLSSADTDFYRLTERTLTECLGGLPILPSITSGATDSRYMREAGIPAYGIGMMTYKFDPTMKGAVHGKNERLDVASLQFKTDFLVKLARNYLGG
jgi:acetylornithine deacetylase/succinyl-diaminopimelate desuccinylase-like protein